ncbi:MULTISPECIES: hypothetical protein [Catenuloplanes]|uniref:Uncharacterized protein n=1 Tax=Catenuloplanes niger TaxID=587534 RepID=A0AAE4A118_9ACTN|nr:hypothetical protein [Catenuloplanes niger]MDR7327270.1 hypothetical protein [Catenuloplanes niger]
MKIIKQHRPASSRETRRDDEYHAALAKMMAASGALEIARDLFTKGQWRLALTFLVIADRCKLPEAEADLLYWRATGRPPNDNSGATSVPVPAPRRWIAYWASTASPYGWRPGIVMAALLTTGLATGLTLAGQSTSTQEEAGTRRAPVHASSEQAGRTLPEVAVSFSAIVPTGSAPPQAPPSEGSPQDVAELRVALTDPPADKYVVTLRAAVTEACEWRIVKSPTDGLPNAAIVSLAPGQSGKVTVPVGQLASLSIFPQNQGQHPGCTVVSGQYFSGAVPTVPATAVPPDPADQPDTTVPPTSHPAGTPSSVQVSPQSVPPPSTGTAAPYATPPSD